MESNDKNIKVDFIIEEAIVANLLADIEADAGKLDTDPRAWDIPPDLLDDYSDPQFDPFTVVAVTTSIGFIVKRISDVWLDHKYSGGQVVDTRAGKLIVRRAPYLKRGTLVVQSDEKTQVFEPNDKDQALTVLEKIGTLAGG